MTGSLTTPSAVIPRRVHLFWSDPQGQDGVPEDMARNAAVWQERFPDFEVRIWLRDELRDLLEDFHGLRVWDALRACRFESVQSDLARLALLYEHGGFYSDLRTIPLRPFLYELLEIEAAIITAHPPTISDHASRLSNAFLGSIPGHPLWRRVLSRGVRNIEARRQLSAVELAGIGPLEGAMAMSTLTALRSAGPWEGLETTTQGTRLRGTVGFIVVPSRIAWSSGDGAGGWMRQTAASYINRQTPHWSVRERSESPYLTDEELEAIPLPPGTGGVLP